MALKKAYVTDYGDNIVAEYWKVVELSLNWWTAIGRIRLAGFATEEDRLNNKMILQDRFYNINPVEFPIYYGTEPLSGGNPIEQSYNLIKVKDTFFSDAENV